MDLYNLEPYNRLHRGNQSHFKSLVNTRTRVSVQNCDFALEGVARSTENASACNKARVHPISCCGSICLPNSRPDLGALGLNAFLAACASQSHQPVSPISTLYSLVVRAGSGSVPSDAPGAVYQLHCHAPTCMHMVCMIRLSSPC